MATNITLSIDQNDLLRIIRAGGVLKERTGTWDYFDLIKLADAGFVTWERKRKGWNAFDLTDAGREALKHGVE